MSLTDSDKEHLRTVQLNAWEVQFLGFIAARGGEVMFDGSKVKKEVAGAVSQLVKKHLLSELPASSFPFYPRLRLTDQGRQVCAYLWNLQVGIMSGT